VGAITGGPADEAEADEVDEVDEVEVVGSAAPLPTMPPRNPPGPDGELPPSNPFLAIDGTRGMNVMSGC